MLLATLTEDLTLQFSANYTKFVNQLQLLQWRRQCNWLQMRPCTCRNDLVRRCKPFFTRHIRNNSESIKLLQQPRAYLKPPQPFQRSLQVLRNESHLQLPVSESVSVGLLYRISACLTQACCGVKLSQSMSSSLRNDAPRHLSSL